MAGCTVSLLAFAMAMEVIIRASTCVIGGKRMLNGMCLPPVRDDMKLLITTVPCIQRLLDSYKES